MAELRWYGHTAFRIKAKEATILIDPVDRASGYNMGRQNADIVVLTGDPHGQNLEAIRPEYQVINRPGEYEMHGVFVFGTRTYQDANKGADLGYNTAYVLEIEGLKIGHLGNVGHTLTEVQAETLEEVDILLVPVGGETGLTYDKAAQIVTDLAPKMVIPMRYATDIGDNDLGSLAEFSRKLGVEVPAAEEKLVIKPSDLGETMTMRVLIPDAEPVRR